MDIRLYSTNYIGSIVIYKKTIRKEKRPCMINYNWNYKLPDELQVFIKKKKI